LRCGIAESSTERVRNGEIMLSPAEKMLSR